MPQPKKPVNLKEELAARDAALDAFEIYREELLAHARIIAHDLADQDVPYLTAGLVYETLHDDLASKVDSIRYGKQYKALLEALLNLDKRWMGGIFRSKEWSADGMTQKGSHGRWVTYWLRVKPFPSEHNDQSLQSRQSTQSKSSKR